MHIECPVCGALFDEDENIRCPKCRTPIDQLIPCGGCGGCCSKGSCHTEKAESK